MILWDRQMGDFILTNTVIWVRYTGIVERIEIADLRLRTLNPDSQIPEHAE